MKKTNNTIRAKVTIEGTRPLIWHKFGPESIPLEKQEKTGIAGNDPQEWRKTYLATKDGQLYFMPANIFACLRDGSRNTKQGRGSIMPVLSSTLQVENERILINRFMPKKGDPPIGADSDSEVYIDVCGVRNPATKARNVRYRVATKRGWKSEFVIVWDKTLVNREIVEAVCNDSGALCGLGDGRSVGNGRFVVTSFEVLDA